MFYFILDLNVNECVTLEKISNFQEKWKNNNNNNNCHNGSGKPRKFPRSLMTKRIVTLDSSREIQ